MRERVGKCCNATKNRDLYRRGPGDLRCLRAAAVGERINLMRVQLFAEVLPAERLVQLPPGAQEQVSNIRIDFRPSL